MTKPQSITSLPRSPTDDRRSRMIRYLIAMTIRALCLVACLFVHGWWLLVPAIGAIALPYFAVVLANAGTAFRPEPVMRPGALVRVQPEDARDPQ